MKSEIEIQRTPAQLCTKLQYYVGQGDANANKNMLYIYRTFANFAIVVSYMEIMQCSFVFVMAFS
jgi:hypothetical protein